MCVRMWYWDLWYNMWWYNIWRSTSFEHGWNGLYNMWWSTIWWSKSRCVRECGLAIDDIMCDDVTYEDLHPTSLAGMDDIIYDDLTYDDLNPDVFENVVLGLTI